MVLLSQNHLSAQSPQKPAPPQAITLDDGTQIIAAKSSGEDGARRFEGQVMLRRVGLVVRSGALREAPSLLEATGSVRLSAFSGQAALFAMADKALIGPETLTLEGSVRLQRPGGGRIEGVRAVIDLKRQHIEVEAARGRLPLGAQQVKPTPVGGGGHRQ